MATSKSKKSNQKHLIIAVGLALATAGYFGYKSMLTTPDINKVAPPDPTRMPVYKTPSPTKNPGVKTPSPTTKPVVKTPVPTKKPTYTPVPIQR